MMLLMLAGRCGVVRKCILSTAVQLHGETWPRAINLTCYGHVIRIWLLYRNTIACCVSYKVVVTQKHDNYLLTLIMSIDTISCEHYKLLLLMKAQDKLWHSRFALTLPVLHGRETRMFVNKGRRLIDENVCRLRECEEVQVLWWWKLNNEEIHNLYSS
jgi:hypothetical protein